MSEDFEQSEEDIIDENQSDEFEEELDENEDQDNENQEDEGDNEEDEADEEDEEKKELEDVEYNGKKYKLPPELKEAFLRQSDYTKKTQDVAEQRRAVEAQQQQAHEALQLMSSYQQQYAKISTIDSQLEKLANLDWNSAITENPVEAMKLQQKYNELRETKQLISNEINDLKAQVEQKRQAEEARMIQESVKTLQRDIPGWNQELYQAVLKDSQNYGFSHEELASVIDARHIKVLYDAMKHRQSQEKLKKQSKPAAAKPTTKVKQSQPTRKRASGNLSTEEWLARRNAELSKRKA